MKRERRVKKSSVMAMAMFSSHGLDDPDNVEISTIGVLLALGPQGTCSSGLAQSRATFGSSEVREHGLLSRLAENHLGKVIRKPDEWVYRCGSKNGSMKMSPEAGTN